MTRSPISRTKPKLIYVDELSLVNLIGSATNFINHQQNEGCSHRAAQSVRAFISIINICDQIHDKVPLKVIQAFVLTLSSASTISTGPNPWIYCCSSSYGFGPKTLFGSLPRKAFNPFLNHFPRFRFILFLRADKYLRQGLPENPLFLPSELSST